MKIATGYMFSNKLLIRAEDKNVYFLQPGRGYVTTILV
jgi:hypothetical protein